MSSDHFLAFSETGLIRHYRQIVNTSDSGDYSAKTEVLLAPQAKILDSITTKRITEGVGGGLDFSGLGEKIAD